MSVFHSRYLAGVTAVLIATAPCINAPAGWQHKSAGLPWVESVFPNELGKEGKVWTIIRDDLGRLYVGSNQLQVYDGQAWKTFPVPNSYAIRSLVIGEKGLLWTGAVNEVGYFHEESSGTFKYRSLVPALPAEERLIGDVWACVPVGRSVYFICRNRVLRWDGEEFHVTHFKTATRLYPLQLDGGAWFHHPESGLYRLKEEEAHLEIPADELPPDAGIVGLANHPDGMLCITLRGCFLAADPLNPVFAEEVNRFINRAKLSCFAELPDGNYALGSLNGGMALITRAGQLLRTFDTKNGLPDRMIFSILPDGDGYAWCTTPNGVFRIELTGRVTVFNELNGLKGENIQALQVSDSDFYALNVEGIFRLHPGDKEAARFEQFSQLTQAYGHLLPYADGLLLSREGGVDYFDNLTLKPLFAAAACDILSIHPSKIKADHFWLLESNTVSTLTKEPAGNFIRNVCFELPDMCNSIHEDDKGRLWLGTLTKGAYVFDPTTQQLTALRDPNTGQPWAETIHVVAANQWVLLVGSGRILRIGKDGNPHEATGSIPAFHAVVVEPLLDNETVLLAFKRTGRPEKTATSLATFSMSESGNIRWRDLDVPALETIGSVHSLKFVQETNRLALWVGGSAGALQLAYDDLSTLPKPLTPSIRLEGPGSDHDDISGYPAFSFPNRQLNLRLFDTDYPVGKDYLFQTRLGTDGWSVPSSHRSIALTDLAEGSYRFEARALNSAGMISDSSVYSFHILAPWFRSVWAYVAYVIGLLAAVLGIIHLRERRANARTHQLELLVATRTRELIKANAVKDEFLANISHEIRNPMNGVIGIAEGFNVAALDPENRHKFSLLKQCARHLSSLLEDILDFSRLDAGMVELENKPFNLPELVDSVAAIMTAESERTGPPLEVALSSLVPEEIIGDERRVRQILLNFVGNAVKYAGRGKIFLTIWRKEVSAESTEIIFAVSDEGPGIPRAEQDKLFNRFERGSNALSQRVDGTGLGLALCKALAEKMGGRVWLDSEEGHGACFYFSAIFAHANSAPPRTPSRTYWNSKLALVVDDLEYNRVALSELLESFGISVLNAADGAGALAQANQHRCDLIFLDCSLPDMSGTEIAQSLRAREGDSAKAIILATTAFNTPEHRERCVNAGMNGFLNKPVTTESLRAALAATLHAKEPILPPEMPRDNSSRPADRLVNLRRLAAKKQVLFNEELTRYVAEVENKMDELEAALQREGASIAGFYAHALCGLLAYTYEYEAEADLRKIQAAAALGQWQDARLQAREVKALLRRMRVRFLADLASSSPA